MLSKKSIKVISVLVLAVMMLITLGNVAMAVTIPPVTGDVAESADLNDTIGKVLGVIQWAGIIIAVIIAMFVGIKFITSSPEGKAEVKKTALFYVGGIVLLLAASTIVRVIANSIKSGTVA